MKRAFLGAIVKFSVAAELEEEFEESCRDNPEMCRDIVKVKGEGIVSRHYFSCRNIKVED